MYSKILIATDGSDLADKGLDHGLALAKATGASVVIVTVTEIWSGLAIAQNDGQNAAKAIEVFEQAATDQAKAVLDAAAARARSAGIEPEVRHVRDRRPGTGILDTARDTAPDLIVMASHGRRGLNRVLLGSQTVEVLTHGTIPVLVVR